MVFKIRRPLRILLHEFFFAPMCIPVRNVRGKALWNSSPYGWNCLGARTSEAIVGIPCNQTSMAGVGKSRLQPWASNADPVILQDVRSRPGPSPSHATVQTEQNHFHSTYVLCLIFYSDFGYDFMESSKQYIRTRDSYCLL